MSEPDHDGSPSSNDELEEGYHYAQIVTPSRYSPLVNVTPKHSADRTASLSTAAKHALMSKSRTPERCFMTLENAPQSAIEVCHFIPKGTKASKLLTLEYNIGLPARTLDVNMVQNLDFLRADLHRSFNHNDWMLIPSTNVLNRIERHVSLFVRRRDIVASMSESSDMYDKFACAPPDWHEYRVMYLNLREDITVIRQDWLPPPRSTAGSCSDPPNFPHFEYYRAPFTKFPIIQSHVHPFCVIYNAGQKLQHKPYLIPPSHIDRADLHMVKRLYDQFTAPPPPTWGHDVPIAPREPLSNEGGSRKRGCDSIDPGPSTRQGWAFAETSGEITQTAHTSGKVGPVDGNGVHLSKRYRIGVVI